MSFGQGFVAITPSDTVNIARDANGEFPCAFYVGATGTTATGLVGIYL